VGAGGGGGGGGGGAGATFFLQALNIIIAASATTSAIHFILFVFTLSSSKAAIPSPKKSLAKCNQRIRL
jgi:hypothetical protein